MRTEWYPGISPPGDGDAVWIADGSYSTDIGWYDADQHVWRMWTGAVCVRPRWWARIEVPRSPLEKT